MEKLDLLVKIKEVRKSLEVANNSVVPSGLCLPTVSNLKAIEEVLQAKMEKEDSFGLHLLSKQQRHIMDLLIQGDSIYEIAIKLEINEGTVKNHLTGAYRKLGVQSAGKAVSVYRTLTL